MATIHISRSEAEQNIAELLARVDGETSFLIEDGLKPPAILKVADEKPLTLSECIALLESREQVTLDDKFAEDLDAAIEAHREPLDSSIWD